MWYGVTHAPREDPTHGATEDYLAGGGGHLETVGDADFESGRIVTDLSLHLRLLSLHHHLLLLSTRTRPVHRGRHPWETSVPVDVRPRSPGFRLRDDVLPLDDDSGVYVFRDLPHVM